MLPVFLLLASSFWVFVEHWEDQSTDVASAVCVTGKMPMVWVGCFALPHFIKLVDKGGHLLKA